MRYLFTFLLMAIALFATAQSDDIDSCSMEPSHTAMFDGLDKKGMLSTDDLGKIKKIVAEDKGIKIIRFSYTIDCGEDCEMISKSVFTDTLPAEDLKYIQAMRSRNIFSIECIIGKNKKGELVSCKPFLFYIR
jgi:hypothetical protein